MKITRIKGTNKKKFSKKDGILINIYYFFMLYRYLMLAIIGLAISAFVVLFFMDVIAPNEMKKLDKKATLTLFNELQKAYRHQDAINLMEFKGKEFIEDSPIEIEYKQKLADSYVYVGDYSKAEKMLLDSWNHAPKYLNEIDRTSTETPKEGVFRYMPVEFCPKNIFFSKMFASPHSAYIPFPENVHS